MRVLSQNSIQSFPWCTFYYSEIPLRYPALALYVANSLKERTDSEEGSAWLPKPRVNRSILRGGYPVNLRGVTTCGGLGQSLGLAQSHMATRWWLGWWHLIKACTRVFQKREAKVESSQSQRSLLQVVIKCWCPTFKWHRTFLSVIMCHPLT